MNNDFYMFSMIEKRIDNSKKMSFWMKGIALLLLFTVSFCSLNQPDTTKVAWYLLIPIIWVMFFLDVSFLKKIKKEQFNLYLKQKESFRVRKEIAQIRGEVLLDNFERSEKELLLPDDNIRLPIIYYMILSVINVIGIMLVF